MGVIAFSGRVCSNGLLESINPKPSGSVGELHDAHAAGLTSRTLVTIATMSKFHAASVAPPDERITKQGEGHLNPWGK
jgi:hypothetical protein